MEMDVMEMDVMEMDVMEMDVMEMDNGIIRQFMYKPVGFVPVGTGDDDYE